MKLHPLRTLLFPLLVLAFPGLALAHTGVGETSSLMHGLMHPVSGLDHLLAMVAVGIWSAQSGGRSLWALPAAFVSVMTLGALLAIAGIGLPLVEGGILMSVIALGMLVGLGVRVPLLAAALLTGLFGIFHGHAHGTELAAGASILGYGLGFALTTSLLHGAGILMGLKLRSLPMPLYRVIGAAIVSAGVALALV